MTTKPSPPSGPSRALWRGSEAACAILDKPRSAQGKPCRKTLAATHLVMVPWGWCRAGPEYAAAARRNDRAHHHKRDDHSRQQQNLYIKPYHLRQPGMILFSVSTPQNTPTV